MGTRSTERRPAAGESKKPERLPQLVAPPRRVVRRRARREEILRTAARVFREAGYHSATMDQVAEALMVTKGSLYYYFSSKEEILYALHDHSLDSAMGLLETIRRSSDSPRDQLGRIIEAHLEVIFDELQASSIVLDLSALEPGHHAAIVGKRDRFERAIREIVQAGVKRGEFVPCDPTIVTFAILGSINWVARWYSPSGRLKPASVARQFADFLVRGLVCERRGAFCPLGLDGALKARLTEGAPCVSIEKTGHRKEKSGTGKGARSRDEGSLATSRSRRNRGGKK